MRVATRDMVEKAERADVATVACLTEARVVDALFDGCGALLIPEQDADSPQCRRLRDRAIPFAMVPEETMGALGDGDRVVAEGDHLRLLRG